MKKLSNLSLYDIKKAARNTQNSLFSAESTPFETKLRAITTNDPWGPSTKELQELLDISISDLTLQPYQEVEIICERIAKYLDPEHHISDRRHRDNSITSLIYNAAVSYVNQGSEWRIVNKCLKVLEFLLLHSPETKLVKAAIGANQIYIERVIAKYQAQVNKIEREFKGNDSAIPTAKLQELEISKAILASADQVLSLFNDKEYLQREIEKSLKLSNQLDFSTGNGVKPLEKGHDIPSYEKNFKHKTLDRHKLNNSNIKSRVRNDLAHQFHNDPDRVSVGYWDNADQLGRFKQTNDNSLLDDLYDEDLEDEDVDEEEDYSVSNKPSQNGKNKKVEQRFHDEEPEEPEQIENKPKETPEETPESDDEFGEFETPDKSVPLIDTNFILDSNISETFPRTTTLGSSSSSPSTTFNNTSVSSTKDVSGTSATAPKDTFASLFESAK